MELSIGETAGRYKQYKIVEEIDEGIYRVRDSRFDSHHILKKLSVTKMTKDIRKEISLLRSVNHPNLVRVWDYLRIKNEYYLLMDYAEGKNLTQYISRKAPLLEEVAVRWGVEICKALEYLHHHEHQNFVCGNLKPTMLISTPEEKIKLVSFRSIREEKEKDIDMFSVGKILYSLLTGNDFKQSSEFSPISKISSKLNDIVRRLLEQISINHYSSISEPLEELMALKKESKEKNFAKILPQIFQKIKRIFLLIKEVNSSIIKEIIEISEQEEYIRESRKQAQIIFEVLLEKIKNKIKDIEYRIFFEKAASSYLIEGNELIIIVSTNYSKDQINKKFIPLLQEIVVNEKLDLKIKIMSHCEV